MSGKRRRILHPSLRAPPSARFRGATTRVPAPVVVIDTETADEVHPEAEPAEPPTRRRHPIIWVTLWVVVLLVGAVALSTLVDYDGNAALAIAQDALPLLLLLAWPIALVALVRRHWLLLVVALALVTTQVALVVPEVRDDDTPAWAAAAPRLRVLVANVYVDNPDFERTARSLLHADADVIAVLESNPAFLAAFDRVGGDAYRYRVLDPDDHSDYAAALLSRVPLTRPGVVAIGTANVARAWIPCGSDAVQLLAVNPYAAVDPGGFDRWERQIDALARYARRVSGPFVLTGDLNTSSYRPGFQRLLDTGLTDAHDQVGEGLSASFRLSEDGPLSDLGPVVRLDHALVNDRVRALTARDLDPETSDHRPFLLTAAIDADGACTG